MKDLLDAPLYVDDTPSLSVFELRTKARRLVREHGVRIIIIDYLQLMNASGMAFGSRQEEVSTISRSLKGLAKELNIPIIALSQLNRGVESREGLEGKRPQLSDLRESGAIEQDADVVMFIYRDDYYNPDITRYFRMIKETISVEWPKLLSLSIVMVRLAMFCYDLKVSIPVSRIRMTIW